MCRDTARLAGVYSLVRHPGRIGERVVEHAGEELQPQHVPDRLIDPRDAQLTAADQLRPVGAVGRC